VLAAAAAQHGVLTHAQLVALGLSGDAIKHRVARGKLHRVHRGVYAVGWPQLDRSGQLCPPRRVRQPGIEVHQSHTLTAPELITVAGITVTDPLRTLVDMARRWKHGELDDTIERMSQANLRSPPQT
jgi:hypothetical protein